MRRGEARSEQTPQDRRERDADPPCVIYFTARVITQRVVRGAARLYPACPVRVDDHRGMMALDRRPRPESEREAIATVSEPTSADDALCVCGHPRRAHQHLRRGTDCAFCGAEACGRFRPRRWWHRR